MVAERSRLVALSKVFEWAGSAATVALVAPALEDAPQRDWLMYDFGQATMSMMVAAADLGIGSGHSAVVDRALACGLLELPEDRWCVSLVTLGYPADRPLAPIGRPDRRPLDDVVHREVWWRTAPGRHYELANAGGWAHGATCSPRIRSGTSSWPVKSKAASR